ncbi:DUF2304 domain-containing protein [Saccharibacillus kuerlensis]|uniref:DUF2304 domain-containing protein n=1 Tax=Saccharibacillus kuerlensis TaxID=459527 RepID=A0ABQ2KTF9_9BACL|nr:DUF2304 domain-containing protein [Saccharibacillus kuerlensis]GGN92892.1 hypothetical protein GCM10010969_05870 [Saccharibacillus kuerlensis]
MITLKLQLLLILFSLFVFFVFINRIRKYKLELKYSLIWIFSSAAGVIAAIFPQIFFFIADVMGIELPVNAVFLLAVSSIFLILYSLTVSLSNHSRKLRALTQELALMRHHVEGLEKQLNQQKGGNQSSAQWKRAEE